MDRYNHLRVDGGSKGPQIRRGGVAAGVDIGDACPNLTTLSRWTGATDVPRANQQGPGWAGLAGANQRCAAAGNGLVIRRALKGSAQLCRDVMFTGDASKIVDERQDCFSNPVWQIGLALFDQFTNGQEKVAHKHRYSDLAENSNFRFRFRLACARLRRHRESAALPEDRPRIHPVRRHPGEPFRDRF